MSDLIDREAVIDLLKKMRKDGDMVPWEGKDVFARIRKLPTIQPEERTEKRTKTHACDLISRQTAIDAVVQCTNCGDEDTLREYVLKHSLDSGWTGGILEALDAVKDLPPAQPERKRGEWLPDNNNEYEMRFVCSCCKESEVVPTIGFIKYKPIWDFCPNCGAKMEGANHETD